ncbi:inactive ribonuclease-like protein 9 [Phodopus roborovskii]|uniref:Inactive ribonuclease-like protein 9 n=1 Tax=Phodopus roborovskii TaxID=109678 RepID=A0AAU9YUH2_PHORO|nr:inactive ribonuclease-like protein 9 [Phodopus roborovskii]CAH6778991.1 Rnase9 [Phodopus roborovskii]
MTSLVTKYPWPLPLLLLLLLPLKLQGDYWDYSEYELNPELRDYLRELYSTGPTKPPTKERIREKIIAEPERPFNGDDYCDNELKLKNIHNKLLCYPEHYFVSVPYEVLKNACHSRQVKCMNGTGFCRRSMNLMNGVQCTLVSGKRMPHCSYRSIFMTGYAVVTCQWDDDSKDFIPNNILEILVPK